MKRVLSFLFLAACSTLLLSSCFKKDSPVAITKPEQTGNFEVLNGGVKIGEDYSTQVYYSFHTGVVASNPYTSWDICLTAGTGSAELWMNGGKEVLVYPTGKTDYASVTTLTGLNNKGWKYDNPTGLPGKSGIGLLSEGNHIGEVMIVDDGDDLYFKFQIVEITADHYLVKTGPLEAVTGQEVTLDKDDNYNFIYYSFTGGGVVKPEPPKKDWDVLFTRYRHIYYGYEEDGSDKPYMVNGVLTNPYRTQSGEDSTKGYEFYGFDLAKAQAYTLKSDRDIIGFDWKSPNINTGEYTVNTKAVFVIKDQQEALWKMHFTSFYGSDGKKGSPQFEYQRLQ